MNGLRVIDGQGGLVATGLGKRFKKRPVVRNVSISVKRGEAVEKDGKTFYRTSVVGFPSRAAAEAFCRSLSAKGHVCFAKG